MAKRTLKQVRKDLADIQRLLVNQSIYVDMVRNIYENARVDLAAHEQRCGELVEELAQHLGGKR